MNYSLLDYVFINKGVFFLEFKNQNVIIDMKQVSKKPVLYSKEPVACPFCNYEAKRQNGSILKEGKDMYWTKNDFPTLQNVYQTLIIETMTCDKNILNYSIDHLTEVIRFSLECRDEIVASGEYQDVLYLQNFLRASGGSVPHAHSQLIALKDHTINIPNFNESLKGPIVFEKENFQVNVSENPISEYYEFNIIWEDNDSLKDVAAWLQSSIQYTLKVLNGFEATNFAYYEFEGKKIFKVIPRKHATSIMLIGYNLHHLPSDFAKVAEVLYDFHNSKLIQK